MNVYKKLGALTVVIALAMTFCVMASASSVADFTGTTGIASGFTNDTTITPLDKSINIKKDIVVYSTSGTASAPVQVYTPNLTYTYTVEKADITGDPTITDATDAHDGSSVIVHVKQGILDGLKVNDGNPGTSSSDNVTGTLVFVNNETAEANNTKWSANTEGYTNTYNIKLDFSSVSFTQPGVYRYKISETLPSDKDYHDYGMSDGTYNAVYLDVYVNGNLSIYGYVCMKDNGSVTTTTAKTNGFVVTPADSSAPSGADSYYTYDLTLSKTVTGDTYAESHSFPFTVFFNADSANGTALTATFRITEELTKASGASVDPTGFSPTSDTSWSGVVKIRHGESITYHGIPCGFDVDVYETNDLNDTTYKVTTALNGGTTLNTDKFEDASVVSGTDPGTTATAQTSRANSQSTKRTIDTSTATKVASGQSVAITNALLNISPTGVTLRYAPYLLTLGAGIVALPLTKSYKKREDF